MTEPTATSPHPLGRHAAFGVLAGAIILYLALVLPMVFRHGITWDEQTDIAVASTYPNDVWGWVVGSGVDAANMRLPMYLAGIVFGVTGETSLLVARLISCLFGTFTILGVYVFCRRELDPSKAVAAVLIVATSPYFLPFSKVAFTEGDIFITCGVIWTLIAAARFLRARTLSRCVVLGIALGLALSAKISAVAVVAPVVLYIVVSGVSQKGKAVQRRPASGIVASAWAAAICAWIAVGMAYGVTRDWPRYDPQRIAFLLGHYAAALAAWSLLLVWAFRARSRPVGALDGAFAMGAIATATFFIVPPVHMTNPRVAGTLWQVFTAGNEEFHWAMVREATILHAAVITLKPSLVVGVSLWIGLLAAAVRWRSRPELHLPVLVCVFYFPFLVRMPWAQTFHMMPLFAVLAIFAADAWVDAYRRWKAPAGAAAVLAVGFLVHDFAVAYPDLQLNGYQWVGTRFWGGRATLGPRGIAQLTPDGLEQCLRWAETNVADREVVVGYTGTVSTQHIVSGTLPDRRFMWIEGEQVEDALDLADYVLITLAGAICEGHGVWNPAGDVIRPRYDVAKVGAEFNKVFAVRRRFGLEVASVWRRKSNAVTEREPAVGSPSRTPFGTFPVARPVVLTKAPAAERRGAWAPVLEGIQLRPGKTARRITGGCSDRSFITFGACAEISGALLLLDVNGRRSRHRLESDETILVPATLPAGRPEVSFRIANQGPGVVMVTWTLDPAEARRWRAAQPRADRHLAARPMTSIESGWCLVHEHRMGRLATAGGGDAACGPEWRFLADAVMATTASDAPPAPHRLPEDGQMLALAGVSEWNVGERPPVRIEAERINALGASAFADGGPEGVRCCRWKVPERGTHGPDRTVLLLGTAWCPPGRYRATCRLRRSSPADLGKATFSVRVPQLLACGDLEPSGSAVTWREIALDFALSGFAPVRFELKGETGDVILVDRVDLRPDVKGDIADSLGRILLAASAAEPEGKRRLELAERGVALAPDSPSGGIALAETAAANGADSRATRAARAAVDARPCHPAVLYGASEILAATGHGDDAADLRQRLQSLRPSARLDTGFSAGIRLLGWDPPAALPGAGERFTLNWYWTADRDIRSDWACFVHFSPTEPEGPCRFQDDHVPVDEESSASASWTPGSVVRVSRSVLVPPDTPAGEYAVRLGLVSPRHPHVKVYPQWVDVGRITVGGSTENGS